MRLRCYSCGDHDDEMVETTYVGNRYEYLCKGCIPCRVDGCEEKQKYSYQLKDGGPLTYTCASHKFGKNEHYWYKERLQWKRTDLVSDAWHKKKDDCGVYYTFQL